MTTQTILKNLRLRNTPMTFSSLERAYHFAKKVAQVPMRVVLEPEDEENDRVLAWVVCPSDAARLERAGFEIFA